jgi:hypothetical protein
MGERRLYTEDSVRALPAGSELVLGRGVLATPAALDLAFARGVRVRWSDGKEAPAAAQAPPASAAWQALLARDGTYVVRVRAGQAELYELVDGVPRAFPAPAGGRG